MIEPHFALGINLSHDRAAVLVKDGKVELGIAEERLDRVKHSIVQDKDQSYLSVLPQRAIKYCLDGAKVSLADVNDIVVVGSVVYHPKKGLRNLTKEEICAQLPDVPPAKISILNHHLAHACSSFLSSPFSSAAILVADGAGNIAGRRKKGIFSVPDVEHTTAYSANDGVIKEVYKICADKKAMNSLGALYNLVTLFAGFASFEEGKTMGLAPYGSDRFISLFEKAVQSDDQGYLIAPEFQPFDLRGRIFNQAFLDHFGNPRTIGEELRTLDKDLAKAVQVVLEKQLVTLASQLRDITGEKNLCIAGGVGLNCVANEKIAKEAGYEKCFFTPCAGDDGTALGGALWAWNIKRGKDKRYIMHSPFLGREYSISEIEDALKGYEGVLNVHRSEAVEFDTARILANGKSVGWFQGGSEFGPRALGHRSILFDPRKEQAKDVLNKNIKHREQFRPFAPSVVENRAKEYFDLDVPSPFMLLAVKVKNPELLPGITHVDGSARVQTVSDVPEHNRFYKLLREFETMAGVPVLLNTSFNVAGEPIVETPKDAIKCLIETRLDALVIENIIITKREKELSGQIADLKNMLRQKENRIAAQEQELALIRGSKGWRILTWLNRNFRPWKKAGKPNIL